MGIYIQSSFYGCETTKIKCFMVLMLGSFHNDSGKKLDKFCVTYEECLTLFFLKENGHYQMILLLWPSQQLAGWGCGHMKTIQLLSYIGTTTLE
jgi:hypothetical protein